MRTGDVRLAPGIAVDDATIGVTNSLTNVR
jgi:hypothetical protein